MEEGQTQSLWATLVKNIWTPVYPFLVDQQWSSPEAPVCSSTATLQTCMQVVPIQPLIPLCIRPYPALMPSCMGEDTLLPTCTLACTFFTHRQFSWLMAHPAVWPLLMTLRLHSFTVSSQTSRCMPFLRSVFSWVGCLNLGVAVMGNHRCSVP